MQKYMDVDVVGASTKGRFANMPHRIHETPAERAVAAATDVVSKPAGSNRLMGK